MASSPAAAGTPENDALFNLLSKSDDDNPMESFAKAMKEVPLLMTPETMPKDTSSNSGLMAIQSLLYDGNPDEIAENFKKQGNECFKEGKVRYKDAIEFYGNGILQDCNPKLKSVLFCNRAAVHLENKNYRMAMEDSKEALKFDAENVKAYFRFTKAAHQLGKLDEAMECCTRGLKVDQMNVALLGEAEKLGKDLKERSLSEQGKLAEREKKRAEMKKLDDAVKARGIKMVVTKEAKEDNSPAGQYKLHLDDEGLLHWPVLLVYPEFKLTDLIADFCEEHPFMDHLEEVFEEKPVWDTEGKYIPSNLTIYFETTNAAGKVGLARVKPELTLKKVLSHQSCVVKDCIPAFFIVPKDSAFEKEFFKSYKTL